MGTVMLLKKKKIWILAVDALALLLWLLAPALIRISQVVSPSCPVRSLTGLLCPTCGGTHAVASMVRGDFVGAACHNAFVLFLTALLAASLVLANCACFLNFKTVNKLLPFLANYKFWLAVCTAALLFAIVRNIVLCMT